MVRSIPRQLAAVELGRLLRLDIYPDRGEPWAMVFSRQKSPPLLWSPAIESVIIPMGGKIGRSSADLSELEYDFARWSGRQSNAVRSCKVAAKGRPQKMGSVRRVDYWSDKHDDDAEYTHRASKSNMLYRIGNDACAIYWIDGPMHATERGLIR